MKKNKQKNMIKTIFTYSIIFFIAFELQAQNWTNVFTAGQYDINGKYLGGTETMALVGHKGKLYAAMSYFRDLGSATISLSGGTQINVLETPTGNWKQDLLLDSVVRVSSMKQIVFTKDYLGNSISPDTLLIAGPNNSNGKILPYIKNDNTGQWVRDSITTVSGNMEIRSIGFHVDLVTGRQYVYIGVSDYGIWRGEYNPTNPSKIQWNPTPEFIIPTDTRVMGFANVNGILYIGTTRSSIGLAKIYRRTDGNTPIYNEIWTASASGPIDLRGLTPIRNTSNTGENLWFYWDNFFRRLEPNNNDTVINELDVPTDLTNVTGRTFAGGIAAAYNDNLPLWRVPNTNDSVLLIGFQARYTQAWLTANPTYPNINRRTTDGMYYTRKQVGNVITYQLKYILNNGTTPIDTLLSTRSICISPFASENRNVLYAGGFDCNGIDFSNSAWIYKNNFDTLSTGISGLGILNAKIFPNPFSSTIQIANPTGLENFQLSNSIGQLIWAGKTIEQQDFSSLSNGLYFLAVITPKGRQTIKLIKQ